MAEIHLNQIGMRYGEKVLFQDFSCTFSAPHAYALLGPSGRGKTTLLRLIAGLEKPQSGTIIAPRRMSFCFQEDRLLPHCTVLENIALVCTGTTAKARRETARYWLNRVELAQEANSFPSSLSGGMKRRVALARALAFDASVLLLDEPFRALDEDTHDHMLNLVKEATTDKLLLLVTHDERDAQGMQIVRL